MTDREPMNLDDVPFDEAVATADGSVVLIRSGDGVVAFENRCPHQDLPLAGALVTDGVAICPHHFWRFELPSGRAGAESDQDRCLTPVEVSVTNGRIEVDRPAANERSVSLRDELLHRAKTWNRDDPPEPHHPGAARA